jgi:hypothetical protein
MKSGGRYDSNLDMRPAPPMHNERDGRLGNPVLGGKGCLGDTPALESLSHVEHDRVSQYRVAYLASTKWLDRTASAGPTLSAAVAHIEERRADNKVTPWAVVSYAWRVVAGMAGQQTTRQRARLELQRDPRGIVRPTVDLDVPIAIGIPRRHPQPAAVRIIRLQNLRPEPIDERHDAASVRTAARTETPTRRSLGIAPFADSSDDWGAIASMAIHRTKDPQATLRFPTREREESTALQTGAINLALRAEVRTAVRTETVLAKRHQMSVAKERGTTAFTDTRDGTLLRHRESPFPGVAPRGVTSTAGVFACPNYTRP